MAVAISQEMLDQLSPEVRAALQAQLAPAAPAAAPEVTLAPAIAAAVEKAVAGTRREGFLAHLDFSGVSEEDSFAPLPEDVDFEGQIVHVEDGHSSAGNAMISLRLKVLVPAAHAGRLVFDHILPEHTSDFVRRRCKSLFRACDMLHEEPGLVYITAASPDDLLNEAVRFRIKNDEYNGRITPKVNGLYSRVQDFAEVE